MNILSVISIYFIGELHHLFLHFPIFLFTAALVCDILNHFKIKGTFTIANWLIIIAAIMCIPAIITGLAAAESKDIHNMWLNKHENLGYYTGIFGSLYAGLRISAMLWPLPLNSVHYIGLSILMVALVSWTSDYGGLIMYGTSPSH